MDDHSHKPKLYYQVTLDIALLESDYALGFVNISNIDYGILEEIFEHQLTDEEFLFQDAKAYIIDEALYNKHKSFLDKEIPFGFNFEIFEYSVSLSSIDPKRFKRCYHKHLPGDLTKQS